jgi:hypothetical protein
VEFDDAVDGFGASVVGPLGGEVGQELVAPGPECAAESGDLGDRAAGERLQGGGGDPLSFRETGDEARDGAERPSGGRCGGGVARSRSSVASQLMLYLMSPTRAWGVWPCQKLFDLVSPTGFEPALPP